MEQLKTRYYPLSFKTTSSSKYEGRNSNFHLIVSVGYGQYSVQRTPTIYTWKCSDQCEEGAGHIWALVSAKIYISSLWNKSEASDSI